MKYANLEPDKQVGDYVWNHQASLGKGAFGKVYLGKRKGDSSFVAVKVMSNADLADDYLQKALKNEIDIMRSLSGPNVVRMFDCLQTKNNTYIIGEFCNGGDFRSYLTKKNFLPEKDARAAFYDILSGMKVLVDRNLIHRDLKPENILINDGIFKVADYGFAKQVEGNYQNAMLKTMVGTPLYMSPQILQNQAYTTKSDVWSMGLIYYEMLFGKTPFPCNSQYELVQNTLTMPVKFPYTQTISEESKSFIKGCLQVQESKRFSWPEVFSHPVYANSGKGIELPKPEVVKPRVLDDSVKRFISELQDVITKFCVDVDKILSNFDSTGDGNLNKAEFTKLILVIDPKCSPEQAEECFGKFDGDKSGTISFKEFKSLVLETDYKDTKSDDNVELNNMRANKLLKKLCDVIIDNRIDVPKLFAKFDTSGDKNLNEAELAKLLKIIDDTLTDNETHYIFKKFDANGNGDVSLQEFQEYLKKSNSQINYLIENQNAVGTGPATSSASAQKIIRELKDVIKLNGLDLQMVFKNFDTSGDQNLDRKEFGGLVSVINSRYTQAEVDEVFSAFDSSKEGKVSYKEFSSYLA